MKHAFLFAVLALPALGAQDAKSVYQAADAEPTPVETQILEYFNRFRAAPQAEFELIPPREGVDWKMFKDEMMALKAAPPLVFNLQLLEAARKHSHYMILNGQFHDENPEKAGFTGATPSDRVKAAGYESHGAAEDIFLGVKDAWTSHQGFVVDWGKGGPGGMQPERGHRRNMINPAYREAGTSALPGGGGLSIVHNLGSRNVRMAGGVVYRDANGNRFYDPGEGVAGAEIASGETSVKGWKSGAYAIEVKGDSLSIRVGSLKYSKSLPEGDENLKFDVLVPDPALLKRVDKALEDAAKAASFKASIGVYMSARGLSLDDERRRKADEITREVAAPLEAAQKAVLAALQDAEAAGLKKLLDEQRKPYKATDADAWFSDAEAIAKLKRGVAAFQKQAAAATDRDKKQFVAAMEQEGARLKTSAFKAELDALVALAKKL